MKPTRAILDSIAKAHAEGRLATRRKPRREATTERKPSVKQTAADMVAMWCEAEGLPVPERETLVAPGERRWRFDISWPSLMLAVEIEGGAFAGKPCAMCGERKGGRHNRGVGMRADLEKYAEAVCRGWLVMRVMPEQIKSGQAMGWLARVMRRMQS